MITSFCLAIFTLMQLPVDVHAADYPLNYNNKWTTGTIYGTASQTFTVPYSGYFDVTIAGAQGASYNGQNGGKGQKIVATVWLNKDDEVKYETFVQPSAGTKQNGIITIAGGSASKLYVNGKLAIFAGGGAGQYSDARPSGNVWNALPEYESEWNFQDGEGYNSSTGGNSQSSHRMSIHWHAFPSFYKYQYAVANDGDMFHMYIDTTYPNYPSYLNTAAVGSPMNRYPGDEGRYSGNYIFLSSLVSDVYPLTHYETNCYKYSSGRVRVMCDDAYFPPEWNGAAFVHHGVSDWLTISSSGSFTYACSSVGYLDLYFSKVCGRKHGDIVKVTGQNVDSSWSSNGVGYTDPDIVKDVKESGYTNTGKGMFSFGITQRQYYMNDVIAKGNSYYHNGQTYLVIYDDTVVYFKRP